MESPINKVNYLLEFLFTMKIPLKTSYIPVYITQKLYSRHFCKFQRRLTPQNFTDYEDIKLSYKPKVPEYFNFASDILDRWTAVEKESGSSNPALWWLGDEESEVKWSFEELGFLSRKVANILTDACGLKPGDRVIVILPRVPEWWLLNVACIRAGLVLIPGTTQLTAKDILQRLQTSESKCIITSEALAPAVDSVASQSPCLKTKLLISEGTREGWLNYNKLFKDANDSHSCVKTKSKDPMTIYFTSGTTGFPKMTEHSHCSYGLGLTVNGRYKFKNLNHCTSAGEPMNPQVMEQWKSQTGLDIYEGYGQTETVLICGTFKGMKIKPGSMGKPSPAYDVQIVDENGNILSPGQEGDIAIRISPHGPFSLFSQYTGDPQKTASTKRGNFYLTGDRGIKDDDGYFWFVGRSDDVILSSGYRIGPFEIESSLIEHPAVVESAVVSSPDPIRGEVVKAFVVLAASYKDHDPDKLTTELQQHVKTTTAPYKYPRKVEFVEQLPKTVSGKIRRNELRNREWGKV
ncbi:acyl-coenzyme A synthetase ACSM3, mitochondrial isoform X4 [Bombina bombina]|uniref:acyl-coenzyme A synthetase ACSM3, mitochondrial isoform X4 n=1 Tax=Bombina bombina TaxID=8345 RepID=UPI00235AE74E|nr:acyl-coenzyme A synthetase ACSM3, mitochondrial isoform X4 [Bombina bombina]